VTLFCEVFETKQTFLFFTLIGFGLLALLINKKERHTKGNEIADWMRVKDKDRE